MTINQIKFLKKKSGEIEVQDPKMIPIILYLLKDNNYFKSIKDIMIKTGWSRYLIRQAKDYIELWIEQNYKE